MRRHVSKASSEGGRGGQYGDEPERTWKPKTGTGTVAKSSGWSMKGED